MDVALTHMRSSKSLHAGLIHPRNSLPRRLDVITFEVHYKKTKNCFIITEKARANGEGR
jgi:hypothetical protein